MATRTSSCVAPGRGGKTEPPERVRREPDAPGLGTQRQPPESSPDCRTRRAPPRRPGPAGPVHSGSNALRPSANMRHPSLPSLVTGVAGPSGRRCSGCAVTGTGGAASGLQVCRARAAAVQVPTGPAEARFLAWIPIPSWQTIYSPSGCPCRPPAYHRLPKTGLQLPQAAWAATPPTQPTNSDLPFRSLHPQSRSRSLLPNRKESQPS